jgi:hypothetical protein
MKALRFVAALGGLLALAAAQSPAGAEEKIKLAFIGDSSADGLWGGVTRVVTRDACLKDLFEVLRLGKNGTGLTRPEKFDWVAEAAQVAEKHKPALAVISLGLNDRQSVVLAGQVTALGSADYDSRYGARVAEMIKNATSTGASVIWVGLAAMREAPADADALAKNKVFAAAVANAGPNVTYIDRRKWPLIGGDTFNSYGPLENGGQMVQIRQGDGVHFTAAAEDRAAAELLPKIFASLKARNVPGATACQK